MVKRLSHPIHTGGSSPFNKKEWVIKEWPMCNRALTVSSFLFVRGQPIHSFNTGNMLCNLFSENSSHSDCHSSNIYLFVRGFRSENGILLMATAQNLTVTKHNENLYEMHVCWNNYNPIPKMGLHDHRSVQLPPKMRCTTRRLPLCQKQALL